jgi:uncharacterized protein YkwD
MKNLITLLIVLLSISGYSQLPTDTIGYDSVNVRVIDSLVEVYVNEARVERGNTPLEINNDLREHSYNHSEWMLVNNKFEHSAGGVVGECCLDGSLWGGETYENNAKTLVNLWFNSPPHRHILLKSAFTYGGCGSAIGDPSYGFYKIKSSFALSPILPTNI